MAFLVAAVDLLHWNALKPVIIERVEETTGRQVAVRGDVGIDLFPRPQLTLEDVTLDNPDWAEAEHLLEARRITLTPALGDLLRGQVSWDEAGVSDATLNLEQRADAPGNWLFDTGREERQAQEDSASRLPLRQLSIADSQVHYRAAQTEIPLEFSLSSLEIQADDEALHTEAMLSFRGRRFALEADTAPIATFMDATQAFNGEVSLSSEESQFTATFEISGAPSMDGLRVNGDLNLKDLAQWSRGLGLPPMALDHREVAGKVEREGHVWRLRDIEASAAESRLSGELAIDTSGAAPTLDGRLSSSELDVAALRKAMPESEQETAVSVPVLPDWRGEVALSVDRLKLAETVIQDLQGQLRFAEHTAALEAIDFEMAGGSVEAEARLTSDPETLEAQARLSLQNIDPAQLGMGQDPGATLDAELALELEPLSQRASYSRSTLLANLRIADAQGTYRHEEAGNDLQVTLESIDEKAPPGLRLTANGTFRDKPLALQASGAPLPELFDLQTGSLRRDYPFAAQATSGRLEAATDASLDLLLNPETFAIDLTLDDESGRALESWIGPVLPPLPGYRLAGRLSREGEQWAASRVEGVVGSTPVAGNVEVNATERPEITADIEAGRIELAQFIPADQASDDTARDESLLAPLRSFDGELDLQADALVLPNELVLHDLALDAELDSGRLQADLSRFRLADGSLSGALTLDAGSAAASGQLDLVFDDIALSRLGDTFTTVEDRLGRLSGDLHLDVSEALPGVRRDDLLLPFLGHLSFAPSELRFVDPRAGTDLTLRLETQGAGSGNQTFQLQGEGRYDGAPASLTLQGDPLLDARAPDRPYAVEFEADLVDTSIQLQGSLMRPLALAGLDLQLAVEGPNPQRLSRLLGVSLPELPPYAVSGDVQLEDQRWTFRNMQGQVGDSDLAGRLALDVGVTPPRLEGKLSSRFLELEDLGFLAGATPEETADDRFVLPDTPIVTEGWQGVSADVSFRGESVRAGNLPLSDVSLDFELEDGRGRFAPLRFGVEEGSVDLTLDIDSSTRPPSGTVQVEVKRLDLNDALQHWELADESVGTIAGRGKLWVEGASIAELLASADGGVVALMTGGKLDALLVELAGIDAGQTFLSWARGRGPIPIDCAYADLQARDGVAQMDTFVVDTSDTTFTLGGQLDLNREQVDVSIIAHPKDPVSSSAAPPFISAARSPTSTSTRTAKGLPCGPERVSPWEPLPAPSPLSCRYWSSAPVPTWPIAKA
ncbi:AsmA family protein [Billgrantia antri]|uniref:AsmA family protein n=1 Tax=Billgrantia antri TaxID=2846777 RepID=UPI003BEF4A03